MFSLESYIATAIGFAIEEGKLSLSGPMEKKASS